MIDLVPRVFLLVTAIRFLTVADGRGTAFLAALVTTAAASWLLALFLPQKLNPGLPCRHGLAATSDLPAQEPTGALPHL